MKQLRPPIIGVADGRYYNAESPDPKLLTLENIAISMGNTCRWSGHIGSMQPNPAYHKGRVTREHVLPKFKLNVLYYSTAEHSVLGARYYLHQGDRKRARLFMMHDSIEPFAGGDIPTPYKVHLDLVNTWESKGQKVAIDAFELEGDFSMVKEVDRRICRNESICMFHDRMEWLKDIEPLCYEKGFDRTLIRTENWSNQEAANEWYELAHKLELKNKYV